MSNDGLACTEMGKLCNGWFGFSADAALTSDHKKLEISVIEERKKKEISPFGPANPSH